MIIAWTARRARAATPGSTVTSVTPSRRQRSRAAGVVIFMYRHTASGLTGSQRTAGLARRSWCSMPVSVATSTADAVVVRAASSMPPVDSTRVRPGGRSPSPACHSAAVEHPHSGWMNSSAAGSALALRRSSAGLIPACTWHSPSQTCRLARPVTRRTWAPRNWSGRNRTSRSAGTDATTCAALAEVQHRSDSALTSALVFT